MKRSGRIRPKSLAQAREWSEWQRRTRPIDRMIRADLTKARTRFEADLKKELMKNLAKTRPRITPQRQKTLSKESALRRWYWDRVEEFCKRMSPHDSNLWEGIKGYDPRICARCGSPNRLEVDHTKGRGPNKWLGWLLQTLCHFCNCFLKRSSKGEEWDFRSQGFKDFLLKCWHRDWELDWHGRWIKKEKPKTT